MVVEHLVIAPYLNDAQIRMKDKYPFPNGRDDIIDEVVNNPVSEVSGKNLSAFGLMSIEAY